MIDLATGSTTSYTKSLVELSEKLGNSKDRDAMRFIVVHSTKEMERSNRKLQERPKASKREIVELQEKLKAVHTESLTDPLTQSANQKFFRHRA
jgi:diguanylate cyclase